MHTISILHVPGCSGGAAALALAAEIAGEIPGVTVEETVIGDAETAAAAGFRGSPTVLVDGVDVEPEPRPPLGTMG